MPERKEEVEVDASKGSRGVQERSGGRVESKISNQPGGDSKGGKASTPQRIEVSGLRSPSKLEDEQEI